MFGEYHQAVCELPSVKFSYSVWGIIKETACPINCAQYTHLEALKGKSTNL